MIKTAKKQNWASETFCSQTDHVSTQQRCVSAQVCLYTISCTVHTPDSVTGSKFFKQKTSSLKESLKTLDDTRTQSIVTLFNPMEITCDFTCADTLVLIHVCLFSPLICGISGLAVWISFPQWRSKVTAFPSLFFYCF